MSILRYKIEVYLPEQNYQSTYLYDHLEFVIDFCDFWPAELSAELDDFHRRNPTAYVELSILENEQLIRQMQFRNRKEAMQTLKRLRAFV